MMITGSPVMSRMYLIKLKLSSQEKCQGQCAELSLFSFLKSLRKTWKQMPGHRHSDLFRAVVRNASCTLDRNTLFMAVTIRQVAVRHSTIAGTRSRRERA